MEFLRRMMKIRAVLAALLTVPALALVGCAAGPAEAPASTAAAAPTSTATATAQATATGPVWPEDRCRDENLAAEFVERPDLSGAGKEGFAIIITNTSERACSYYGWPGVLVLGADGTHLNSSAALMMEASPGALAPGESAQTEGQLTDVSAYDCTPTTATTVRVLITSDGAGPGFDAPAELQVCDDAQSEMKTAPLTPAF